MIFCTSIEALDYLVSTTLISISCLPLIFFIDYHSLLTRGTCFITDTLITIFILPFHLLSSLAHRIEVRLTTPPSKAGDRKAATKIIKYHIGSCISPGMGVRRHAYGTGQSQGFFVSWARPNLLIACLACNTPSFTPAFSHCFKLLSKNASATLLSESICTCRRSTNIINEDS